MNEIKLDVEKSVKIVKIEGTVTEGNIRTFGTVVAG